jgi:hypothetical protein
MPNYRKNLIKRLWKYQKERFPDLGEYFDSPERSNERPPVFLKNKTDQNVVVNQEIPADKRDLLLGEIPMYERHRWFRSMFSSQALAQSIFGNLKIYNRLNLLNNLFDESGEPLFGQPDIRANNFFMEHSIDHLGEPRRTSVDAFISGNYQVAIECKLTESEVGSCSRTRLRVEDSNYEADFCNGTYFHQMGRNERCSLTEIGVKYWKYIPKLFSWRSDIDLRPCPLNKNYQLVRNLLAACVRSDGTFSPEYGHAVLVYDERSPAIKKGGKIFISFEEVKAALIYPNLLRKCSWQNIAQYIKQEPDLKWLTKEIELKYGIKGHKFAANILNNDSVKQSLDYIYDKAINGIPGTQSAMEMADYYLSHNDDLEEKVNSLIRWQNTKSATSGFLLGLGGALTLPVAIPANLASVLYVQMRMIAAIAYMGGYDLKDDRVRTLVYVCLCGNAAKDILKDVGIMIGTKLTKQAITKVSYTVISKINRAVGFRLLTKFGTKGAINLGRAIPIAGGIVGGGVDLLATNTIGNIARNIFIRKKNLEDGK